MTDHLHLPARRFSGNEGRISRGVLGENGASHGGAGVLLMDIFVSNVPLHGWNLMASLLQRQRLTAPFLLGGSQSARKVKAWGSLLGYVHKNACGESDLCSWRERILAARGSQSDSFAAQELEVKMLPPFSFDLV